MRKNIQNAKRKHPKHRRRWCKDRQQARQELREIKRATDALQICSATGSNDVEEMMRVIPCMPQTEREAIVDMAKRVNASQGGTPEPEKVLPSDLFQNEAAELTQESRQTCFVTEGLS